MKVNIWVLFHGKSIQPDDRHTWLTEGLHAEFDDFIPMGTKAAKARKGETEDVIFKTYSNGVKTNRDAWVNNFNRDTLVENMSRMIEIYNMEVARWGQQIGRDSDLDNFLESDDTKIKWSSTLKQKLQEWAKHGIYRSKNPAIPLSSLYEIKPLL